MEKKRRELIVPPNAEHSAGAYEIIRVWLTNAGPHCTLLPNTWSDPAAWGLLFVDIADHVATAISHGNENTKINVLSRIKEGFDAEWAQRTGKTQGGFVNDE